MDKTPCPNCGLTETLSDLREKKRKLEKFIREQNDRRKINKNNDLFWTTSHQITIEPSVWVDFGHQVCTGCGTAYVPDFKDKIKEIEDEIAEIMKKNPLDVLALESRDGDLPV